MTNESQPGSAQDDFWGDIDPTPTQSNSTPPSAGSDWTTSSSVWDSDTVIQPDGPSWDTFPTQQPVAMTMNSGKADGPPWLWLYLAVGVPLVLGVGCLIIGNTWVYAVGWALVVLAGFGLLMVFTNLDLAARVSNSYIAHDYIVAPLRIAVVIITLVLSLWNAWRFADWFARLPIFMGMG